MTRDTQPHRQPDPDPDFLEETKEQLEDLFERIEEYMRINAKLYKLQAVQVISDAGSAFLVRVLLAIVGFLFFFLANIGAALWIGEKMDSTYSGYFIVSGFYLLIFLLLWMMRKSLFKRGLTNAIADAFSKN
jgi:hypothetical protein